MRTRAEARKAIPDASPAKPTLQIKRDAPKQRSELPVALAPLAPLLVDSATAARLLCISGRRLREWAKEGRVPAIRYGKGYRFSYSALKRWIDEGGLPSVEDPERQ
jgi:excisionase family DNA binding protein